MATDDLLRERREEILRIAAKHGSRNVRVFGSAARREAGDESDVDLLVEFESGRTLLDQAGLVVELESSSGGRSTWSPRAASTGSCGAASSRRRAP